MGTYQEPCLLTVGEWLDIWMAEYNVHLKPRTAESYRCQIENHLRPELGKYKLEDLRPHIVQHFLQRPAPRRPRAEDGQDDPWGCFTRRWSRL